MSVGGAGIVGVPAQLQRDYPQATGIVVPLGVITAPRCEHRQVRCHDVEPHANRRVRGRLTQPQNRPQLGDGGRSCQAAAMREVAAPQGVAGAFEGIDVCGTHLPWRFVGVQARYQPVEPVQIEICLPHADGDSGDRLPEFG